MNRNATFAVIVLLLAFFFVSSAYILQISVLQNFQLSKESYLFILFVLFNSAGILGMLFFSQLTKRFPDFISSRISLLLHALVTVLSLIFSVAASNQVISVAAFCFFMFNAMFMLAFAFYSVIVFIPNKQRGWCICISYAGGIALNCLTLLLPFKGEPQLFIITSIHLAAIIAVYVIYGYLPLKDAAQQKPAEGKPVQKGDFALIATFALFIVLLHGINTIIKTQYVYSDPLVNMILCRLLRIPGLFLACYVSSVKSRNLFFLAVFSMAFMFLELDLYKKTETIFIASSISYFLSGFHTYYLLIVFVKYSALTGNYALYAGMGELFFRLGDMLSYLVLGKFILLNPTTDLVVVSVLFVILLYLSIKVEALHHRDDNAKKEGDSLALRLNDFKNKYGITDREYDVVKLAVNGHPLSELAKMLYISEATVKFHLSSIYRKTGVKSRNQLMSLIMMKQ